MNRKFKTILCAFLTAAMMSAITLPMSGCEKKADQLPDSSQDTIETPVSPKHNSTETGGIQAVFDALVNEGSDYNELKSFYPSATFTETVDGNKIVITVQSESEYDPNGTWEYVQDKDFITFHSVDAEDYFGSMLFTYVASAVADSLGMDSRLMTGYINGLGFLNMKSNKYSHKEKPDGTHEYKLYMKKPFEMKELDKMYVNDVLLNGTEPLTDEFTSTSMSIGKLAILMNGNKSSLKLLVKEYEKLDDLAVKSVVNMVKVYQPDGYESFVKNFKSFEDTSTDTYTVNANPDDIEIFDMIDLKEEEFAYAIITFGEDTTEETTEEVTEEISDNMYTSDNDK